ncbi:MAG TPA: MarR family transcriptional regulator [Caulobacteraceae bacterium]|jgi:DNA-binding MarR family transcriptional regulator|nr:MarR family transcriptional regulator [Caulobacteraceae bacterium]
MTLLEPDEDLISLAGALRPALLRASRQLRREAQKAGVSALDAQLLGLVFKHPGVGGGELAELEQMSAPSMSAHLKRLEAAGWIARDPAREDDRRRVGLRVTPAGAEALEAIRRRRNDWLAARLAALTPRERRALAAAAEPLLKLAR